MLLLPDKRVLQVVVFPVDGTEVRLCLGEEVCVSAVDADDAALGLEEDLVVLAL